MSLGFGQGLHIWIIYICLALFEKRASFYLLLEEGVQSRRNFFRLLPVLLYFFSYREESQIS